MDRFEAFAGLSRETRQALARHVRLVDVPGQRWLLQPGRALSGSHFLVRGTVRSFGPDRLICGGQPSAKAAIYPGAEGLRTLTDCRLLQLSDNGLELLTTPGTTGLVSVADTDDCWQTRFLRSQLMTSLSPLVWQRVLSRLEPLQVAAGEVVIAEGFVPDPACCFILAGGAASVVRRDALLCTLSAGDLFGEDALISRRPRNASVRMLEDGVIMRLRVAHFREFLTEVLQLGSYDEPNAMPYSNAPSQSLRFDSTDGLRERVAALDLCVRYLVSAASDEVCALALFLMRKRGLRAFAACSS